MMFISKKPWQKNYEFFKGKLPSLMKKHEGKFALVQNKKIVDVFETEDQAEDYVKKEGFVPGSFLIQEITERVEYLTTLNTTYGGFYV